jgi:hypothetical protein
MKNKKSLNQNVYTTLRVNVSQEGEFSQEPIVNLNIFILQLKHQSNQYCERGDCNMPQDILIKINGLQEESKKPEK